MRFGLRYLKAFIRDVWRVRDRGAAILALAMGSYAMVPLLLLAAPQISPWLIARFHLRSESFTAWALLQPSPWMYNFENYYLVSNHPLTRDELVRPPRAMRWQAINHQTARVITFADLRATYLQSPGFTYFYLRGRYRGHQLLSSYRVTVPSPPGPEAPPSLVKLLDEPQ